MSAGRIVIVGTGGHAKVVLEVLRSRGVPLWSVFAVDDDPARVGGMLLDIPVLSTVADWKDNVRTGDRAIVAIGRNTVRARLQQELELLGVEMMSGEDARAVVSTSAKIGAGSVLMPGAVVNANASIGRGVIVNTNVSIDHDCDIGDFSHIAPGASICGGVRVGAMSLIGVGSSLLPGVHIGDGATVGAGAVVVKDVRDGETVIGVPARVLK